MLPFMKRFRFIAILVSPAVCLGIALFATHTSRLNAVHAAARAGLSVSQAASASADPGAVVYSKQCAICHGDQREGILPAFPPLVGIKHQMSDAQITELVMKGKGRMPAFTTISSENMASLMRFLGTPVAAPTQAGGPGIPGGSHMSPEAEAGGGLFQQNCAFCHGRDAQGGETGPDLTQSKLVLADDSGDKIMQVIREGRVEKKMPAFNFSPQELTTLVAFIHARVTAAASQKGGRRGVTPEDLQTGNVQAGKDYFNGAGGCSKCHSATGDLAGIAHRYQGLQLEERMLYPRDAKSKVTVTLPNGKTISGILAYQDEFTIGLRDESGTYHSWAVPNVKFKVDAPVEAHVEQFPKYTDADIHNLMAYLQTLR